MPYYILHPVCLSVGLSVLLVCWERKQEGCACNLRISFKVKGHCQEILADERNEVAEIAACRVCYITMSQLYSDVKIPNERWRKIMIIIPHEIHYITQWEPNLMGQCTAPPFRNHLDQFKHSTQVWQTDGQTNRQKLLWKLPHAIPYAR